MRTWSTCRRTVPSRSVRTAPWWDAGDDVGSGGGSPGIPLAASLPGREVSLLEAERRLLESASANQAYFDGALQYAAARPWDLLVLYGVMDYGSLANLNPPSDSRTCG